MSTIIYVGGFELPDKNAAAHRVVSNAKILRELKYDVVFMDINANQKETLKRQNTCYGFERWSMNKSNKRLYDITPVIEVIDSYRSDTVTVIAYNYPSVALNKLQKYCKKNSIKIIADVTEWYGPQGNNLIHKTIKSLDSLYRMRMVHFKMDGIIAISHYLENYYESRIPTVFIPPLTDVTEEKWNCSSEQFDDGRIHILYAGTGGKHKDKLSMILHALSLSNYRKVCFHIIGLTKEKYLSLYPNDVKLITALGKSVIFKGRVPHIEVIRELKSCDFSMFYRKVTRVTTAGFPTKFAESITAGVPVLTNKTSDLTEYLVEGVNGFWINNLEQDVEKFINHDLNDLREVKKTVSRKMFDFGAYTEDMDIFLRNVLEG